MAAEYLLAVLQIICPSGSAGSGVCVHADESGSYVLTARHVVGRNTMARVYSGRQMYPGRVIGRGQRTDQALIRVSHPLPAIPLATQYAPQGTQVCAYGFGGSGPVPGQLWRFQSAVHGYDRHLDRIILEPGSISGDSGGPIIQHGNPPTVVGLVTGGELAGWRGPPVNSHGPNVLQLRALLAQHCAQFATREPVIVPISGSQIQKPDITITPPAVQQIPQIVIQQPPAAIRPSIPSDKIELLIDIPDIKLRIDLIED